MNFGQRLKQARKDRKLTQEQVANKLEIDFSTVSKWETSKDNPSHENLIALAEIYGVDAGYLLTGETTSDTPTREPASAEAGIARLVKKLDPDSQRMVLELILKLAASTPQDNTDNMNSLSEQEASALEYVFNKYAIRNNDRLLSMDEVIAYLKVKELLEKANSEE